MLVSEFYETYLIQQEDNSLQTISAVSTPFDHWYLRAIIVCQHMIHVMIHFTMNRIFVITKTEKVIICRPYKINKMK